jgi:hypothetical protein
MKRYSTSFILILTLTLGGCVFYTGSKEVYEDPSPKEGYGFIAFYSIERYEPKTFGLESVRLVTNFIHKNSFSSTIVSHQKEESELKVFYAKPGTYLRPYFQWIDTRLNHGLKLESFEVKAGEVTYVGDYDFTFFMKKGAFGPMLQTFNFDVIKNYELRESEIKKYMKSNLSLENIKINTPNMSAGNFKY